MKYLKRFNESLEKTFQVPTEFDILIQDIGPNPTPSDIIECWNDCIEDNPIRFYHEGSNKFILEDGEITPENVFICLHDYLQGDDEEGYEDYMNDSPKQKRFGDGNENEIYLTNNVRFHRKGDKLTLSYTPTEIGGGLTISDEQKKMLIDFLLQGDDIYEGVTEKAAKRQDKNLEVNQDKIESMRKKVKDHIKSQGCDTKLVGSDLEVHHDDKHIAQVMFRKDYIGIKKVGNKFPKELGYDELGKIKSELSDIIKSKK